MQRRQPFLFKLLDERRSPAGYAALDLGYVLFALFAAAGVVLYFQLLGEGSGIDSPAALQWAFVAAFGATAFGEVSAHNRRSYFAALAVHVALCFTVVLATAGQPLAELVVISTLAVGICLHNRAPWSFVLAGVLSVSQIAVSIPVLIAAGGWTAAAVASRSELAIAVAMIILLSGLAIRYRERFIDGLEEIGRLDRLVNRVTRANLGYQEYATAVQESSAEEECKRITRDIHDVVGYTLTNNITLMEAIIDTIRTNPLGVATLVRAARANAEDGLLRVREALHVLRETQVSHPKGIKAIDRLSTVYQYATGVSIDFAFSDVDWAFGDETDAALYHVVQESLVNSFRHGKATRVRVFLYRDKGDIVMAIKDNGTGAARYDEGIGLAGMRERVAGIRGRLETNSGRGGFEVVVKVPAEGSRV